MGKEEKKNTSVSTSIRNFIDTLKRAVKDSENKEEFTKKCLMNIANSAYFSADRTVREYAEDIWFKE